jgi:hypothetical protein
MQVLRDGGEYLGRRELQLWWCVGTVLAVAVVGMAVVRWPGAIALTIPAAATVGYFALPRLKRIRKGRLGERLVTDLLKQLPDGYYLVNDVTVAGSGGNIDHVVVGPCGVVVIETKRWSGKIRCEGDDWYVNGWPRRSVSRQVNRSAAALRQWLAGRHPEIYSASAFLQSVAVFTHPLCHLEIDHARTTVVRYSELLQVLLCKGEERRMPSGVAGRLAESLPGVPALVTGAVVS